MNAVSGLAAMRDAAVTVRPVDAALADLLEQAANHIADLRIANATLRGERDGFQQAANDTMAQLEALQIEHAACMVAE